MTADPAVGVRESVPEEVTAESGLCTEEESHSTLGIRWGSGVRKTAEPEFARLCRSFTEVLESHGRSWS